MAPHQSEDFAKGMIGRLLRESFSDHVPVTNDARLAVVKSSTAFVKYLGALASELARERKHPTVAPADVISAIEIMGFDGFQSELQPFSTVVEQEVGRKRMRQKETAEKRKKAKDGPNTGESSHSIEPIVVVQVPLVDETPKE